MILSRGPSGLAAILLFCLLINSTQAFFPTTWKETLFGYGGTSHVEQTEIAFAALAAKYFPAINHLTKSMIKARNTIADANADVDDNQHESALHCDGENFDVAQVRLQTLREDIVNQLASGDATGARKSLGSALHTLQDFYAHSNWVELGNTAPSDVLGRASSIAHAGPLDPTCVDCLPHDPADTATLPICLNCRNNEVGFMSLLTSGYYVGEDVTPSLEVAKCHHGGFTDGSVFTSITIGPSNPGINKDSLYCGWSPHFFLHTQAVAVSIAATEQFIDDIKAVVTTSQLRQLFGVGPTLAFVIDTTGSMGDIIATVQDASIQIVTDRLGTPDEPSTYIISPFNDPTTGPVTTTSDAEVFKSTILSLGAGGGDDCPELSITGMINAINVMDDESILFMLTDAASKDFNRAGELISLAVEKSIVIYVFKFDSDCDDGISGGSKIKRADSASDRVYGAISLATSGGYHSLPRDAAANITSLVDSLTLSDSNFISRIADSLPTNGSAAYLVPVDSSLTQITISVRGAAVAMSITDPAGAPLDAGAVGVTIVTLADGSFVTIKSPKAGSWRVEVSGSGTFSLDCTGTGPLHFSSFVFARLAGRPGHTGYYPIPSPPPYNADIAAIAALDGPWATAQFSFRLPDGTTLSTLSMIQGTGAAGDPPTNEFFSQIRLTPVERYIYVDGTDSAGTFYQRLIPTIYSPVFSNETFPLGNITAPPSNTMSSISSSRSLATASSSSSGLGSLYPLYPAYPIYGDPPSSLTAASSSVISASAIYASFKPSTTIPATLPRPAESAGSSTSASHGPFTNTSSSVAVSINFATSTGVTVSSSVAASPSVAISVSLSSSASHGLFTTSSAISSGPKISTSASLSSSALPSDSLVPTAPSSSGTNRNGTSGTFGTSPSTALSVTSTSFPTGISTSSLITGVIVTSTVLTITSECPITVSGTISGTLFTTVTQSTSTIIVTRTSSVPCDKCAGHVSLPTSALTGSSSVATASNGPPAITETELPPVTITEIVYITTSTCPVTISTAVSSGSTSYILTHLITTQTLTSITTAPCDKCGPRTVTLKISSIPPTAPPPYLTPGSPPVGPPGFVTLNVFSVSHTISTPILPPAVPSHPKCFGGDCEIPLSPSPAPPTLLVFSSPPSNPTYATSPGIPAVPSVRVCHDPGCPIVARPPPIHPTGPGCIGVGCSAGTPSTPMDIPPPTNPSKATSPPISICDGPVCVGSPPPKFETPDVPLPPGNATISTPPFTTPTMVTFTGGMARGLTLGTTTVALGLVTALVGIIMF